MKYYKDKDNNVFAYEDDGSQDDFIGDKVSMTDAEIEAHINPPKTEEQLLKEVKEEAQSYLNNTDWYVIRKFERAIEIPSDVSTKRAEAIEVLNQ